MSRSDLAKFVFGLVIAAVAVTLIVRQFNTPDAAASELPVDTFWECQNDECGGGFSMKFTEVLSYKDDEGSVPCPKCNKRLTVRAFQCQSCEKPVQPEGHTSIPEKCPHCGEAMRPPKIKP